jgi:hypothetical protein
MNHKFNSIYFIYLSALQQPDKANYSQALKQQYRIKYNNLYFSIPFAFSEYSIVFFSVIANIIFVCYDGKEYNGVKYNILKTTSALQMKK